MRIASVAIVLVAIGYTMYWFVAGNRFQPSQFFAFFTIQSNLFGVAVMTALVVSGDRPRSRTLELLRGAAALYLTVTFVVVILFLSGADVQLELQWVDFALHTFVTILVFFLVIGMALIWLGNLRGRTVDGRLQPAT